MPANPLQCTHCRGMFIPISDQPWSTVQCPHCASQMKVRDCFAVVDLPVGVSQPYIHVTEEEERAAAEEWKNRRRTRRMAVLGIGGMLFAVVAVLAVIRVSDRTPGSVPRAAGDSPDRKLASAQWPGAPDAVEQFLTAPAWRAMLPYVADAGRVEGIMEWFYTKHDFTPASGPVELLHYQPGDVDGLLRVQAAVPGKQPIWLLLVRERAGWKVDWEVFANAHAERWAAFLRGNEGAEIELPLMVSRKPAATAYIAKGGADPAAVDAVVLWASGRESMAGALLPKTAPEWKDLEGITFNKAVKVIARVQMADSSAEPPLVRLKGIVQRGWVRTAN